MKNLASLLITVASLILITSGTVLYSEGWRINLSGESSKLTDGTTSRVHKTGMIAVRSIPNGAKVYINDVLTTATDDTIASLVPGDYKVRVEHDGFESWEKTLTVYPELVTDITAVLVLQSPRLEPLTNADVKAFSQSSNQNNIAFLTKNHEEPGIWILPLTGSPLNLFKSSSRLLIADNINASPSSGENVWWSYYDKEILVQMNTNGYLLYDISNQTSTKSIPTSITDVKAVFEKWDTDWKSNFLTDKIDNLTNSKDQEVPKSILNKLKTEKSTWSPDDKKFFFVNTNESDNKKADIIIYNSESPLPIGEKRLYNSIEVSDIKNTTIQWYSDSYHLILLEKSDSVDSNIYTISLIRIDGTNKTPIYTGELASNQAYATPSGDKIIVLTSLKENSQTNLYAIAIR
ncbi:hypothetical protein CO058_00160 [candidate division WWE3 bacterium CG_4_9_14_0_2_um_filter_35_11]|uniref:PEGA domain-containing protein n=1 Tax=candidate division WWE3 bacterium CG_4_9_14_0_2_um_filter_35_11 TaxID=1975077 RepID=A0A2M8EMR4_UNCKA|nr:MAG: hypothetical protein COV25_00120 [candidate division WWE3 bacterium CG10_big_fil_rev_8_21_14_0_10_35_32]PJC24032.1 MAG: hypothetical protein CO058_00160 [candidate division WWE3 bacterium CG_4_9_14_0_2_um_filter_35_11]